MEKWSSRVLFSRAGDSNVDGSGNNPGSVNVLLGVILGIACVFISGFILAVVLHRRNRAKSESDTSKRSSERLKKLDAVSPTRTLDQWWPGVKDSLSLSDAVDSQFVCVVCFEPVLRTQQIHELQCLHVFHKECLEKWYLRYHYNCPLCHRAYFHEARRLPTQDWVWMV